MHFVAGGQPMRRVGAVALSRRGAWLGCVTHDPLSCPPCAVHSASLARLHICELCVSTCQS